MSQMFWKTTSYTQRKWKPFVGCKRKLCVQIFASILVNRTTNLTQWKWKPFFMEVYKVYISPNCIMKRICVQPNA
jgi:hypothetical protein